MQELITLHAFFGGIALSAGMIALITKKGGKFHKKSGKIFYYSMLSSAIIALVVSLHPERTNYFLFIIGLFSSYLLLSGFRALRFKQLQKINSFRIDKLISLTMLITGIIMVFWSIIPLFQNRSLIIVLLVFGLLGISLSMRDLRWMRHKERLQKSWLRIHIGNMVGGYIAAFTAFIVVNKVLPGIYGWLTPTVIGSAYITYWMVKLSPKKKEQRP